MPQFSVVHRLPQRYRWCAERQGVIVAHKTNDIANEQDLIALRLLSHHGHPAWEILRQLQETLAEIQVECKIAECEGEPCLFVPLSDESATSCCLKNRGVAIAENFAAQ
ncbi:hypothetical protein [[Erwinia] mediterraneensis]|uniref:hypothetical protein n=1 Tax=[Erwinia] mediterraneensis TaxID=2161819 RepID=UPI0010323C98|nr:hypothetical protein [[Erwinia] mediterraneensis]